MRLCQAVASSNRIVRLALPIFKFLHWVSINKTGVDLPWFATIGPGFTVMHGWGTVISPYARIGSNVTVFNGVTIGRADRILPDGTRQTEFPVIEDEVWIGPHAIVVGGVTIGRGSRIAGGAFVNRSVPPHSIVLGNPGTVVKSGCLPDVINPAPL